MSRADHLIERCFAAGLGPAEERELRALLRDDAEARARYDRMRRLGRLAAGVPADEPTDAELDRLGASVRARLAADREAARAPAAPRPRFVPTWRNLWPAVAVTAAACLALVLWPRPVQRGEVAQRGLPAGPPLCVVEAYAVDGEAAAGGAASAPLGSAASAPAPRRLQAGDRIKLTDYLQFRYQSADPEVRYLYLFGLDQRMTPLDYYPRPGGGESIAIEPGDPSSLGRSIRLEKRHQPGPLKVVGLCSRVPLKRDAVLRAVATVRAAGWSIQAIDHVPVDGVAQSTLLGLEVVP
jgi:hypothetical protein